tara:strand:+ start:2725 stop:3606 length:882 start_codon:yes stop_codon:yes gene_type:complete
VIPFLTLIGIQILFPINHISNSILDNLHLKIIFFGGLIAYFIGLIDDVLNLNAFLRLISQLILGGLTWLFGIRIDNLQIDIFSYNYNFDLPIVCSLIISIIWVAGIINAINWMDGLDGLAASFTLTAGVAFLLISSDYNTNTILLSSSALAGTCLGFLKFNKNPARILMGDGGSYFLGYILSLLAILSCFYRSNSLGIETDLYILLTPMLILFLPLFDMFFVICLRLKKGFSPFKGDNNHLHHRLIRMGYNERVAVKIIISLSIVFSSLALLIDKKFIESLIFVSSIYFVWKI